VPDKIIWKKLTVLITLFCLGLVSFTQQTDYIKIFGSDWLKAEAFVSQNEAWMKRLCDKYDVSYPMAIAVVFPEIVRYSAIRDKIEITLLKALYINLGEDYADFSIGQFQMKPSFAEALHKNAQMLKGRLRKLFQEKSKSDNIKKYREAIVRDLENPESQFLFLIAFLKICENVYPLEDIDEDERLRFLATAYNYSFQKSFDEVNKMTGKKYFYTKLVKGDSYSYADISAYWYENYQNNKKR
jgi:hypothetical protein